MRGSPLFRTVLVVLALVVAGAALARLTRPLAPPSRQEAVIEPAESRLSEAAYRLVLSAPPRSIGLESAGETRNAAEGRLPIDPENPVVFLRIAWEDGHSAHRFAKLTLDLPGKPTMTHVFEAPGDIDDVWEIDLR